MYEILTFLADHKSEFESTIINEAGNNCQKDGFKFYTSPYGEFNPDDAEEPNKKEGDANDEYNYDNDYIDYESKDTVVYAFYSYPHIKSGINTKIHPLNSLFFVGGYYILDELVKILTIDQIKTLNSKGYVIGQYVFYSFSPYSRFSESEHISMVDLPSADDSGKYLTKSNKINAINKELYELKFGVDNSITKFALKEALRKYKHDGSKDSSMIEYLVEYIIANQTQFELFMPEIIWICHKFLPLDHKVMKLLTTDKMVNDYILFGKSMPRIVKNPDLDAYAAYYKYAIKLQIWSEMSDFVLSRAGLLDKILAIISDL